MGAPTVLLVGCGNMGQALLRGWLAQGHDARRIQAIDPSAEAREETRKLGVRALSGPDEARMPADVVILAVKPQQLDAVLPSYAALSAAKAVILSIAAGRRIESYEGVLGAGAAIVRGMPNTPAAIGEGMTVLCANAAVSDEQRDACEKLMAAVGDVAWIGDERLMDAVTAVSGSGPAYVFLLIESLAEAAIEVGIEPGLARTLAERTVAGSGAYAAASDLEAAELRRRVTSPGGTTEAALQVLMSPEGLPGLLVRAVEAATKRGRELG